MSRTTRSAARAAQQSALSPDSVPVLSRGKHRSPRQGACFMEFASFLAGERWSDRPACTDPALAALARLVNDRTSDAERSRLAALVPSVIGLRPDGNRTELLLAFRAAAAALPIASEGRQRILAVAVLRCLERLRTIDPGSDVASDGRLTDIARAALDATPLAEDWAKRHLVAVRPPRTASDTPMCDAVVGVAVAGIAEACVSDPDGRLRELLATAIEECEALQGTCGAAEAPSVAATPVGVRPSESSPVLA